MQLVVIIYCYRLTSGYNYTHVKCKLLVSFKNIRDLINLEVLGVTMVTSSVCSIRVFDHNFTKVFG